MANAKHAPPTT